MKKSRGQVWIETVIYTMISLTIIGALLYYGVPKIEKMQDQAKIESSIDMMKQIDLTVMDIKDTPGNLRMVETKLKKGYIIIDGKEDLLIFKMEGKYRNIG